MTRTNRNPRVRLRRSCCHVSLPSREGLVGAEIFGEPRRAVLSVRTRGVVDTINEKKKLLCGVSQTQVCAFPPGVYSRRLLPLRSGLWSRQRGGVRFSGKGSSTLPGVHSRRLLPPRSGILSHTRGGAVFPGGAPDTEGSHQPTSNRITPH